MCGWPSRIWSWRADAAPAWRIACAGALKYRQRSTHLWGSFAHQPQWLSETWKEFHPWRGRIGIDLVLLKNLRYVLGLGRLPCKGVVLACTYRSTPQGCECRRGSALTASCLAIKAGVDPGDTKHSHIVGDRCPLKLETSPKKGEKNAYSFCCFLLFGLPCFTASRLLDVGQM